MRLNPDQRIRLLDELKDVFTDVAAVKELVQLADPPSLASLDQVALGANLVDILNSLILRADDGNWLGNLLEAAIEMRSASQKLKLLRTEFDGAITAERADHFAACWLLGDRVLVDREPLRTAATLLENTPGSGKPVKSIMVVKGPRMSGRSWSLEYISYLNTTRRSFELVWVDLEDLETSIAEDAELDPQDLGLSIATQMHLDMTHWPARVNEKDERWARRYCEWLKGELTGKQALYWIVVDSFDKMLLPDGIYILISELAKWIRVNLQMLRLVLLSYDKEDDLPANVRPDVAPVSTGAISDLELLAFFTRLYDERKRRFDIDFSPTDVANSVAEVKRQVDFSNERYLFQLGPAVVQEANKLRGAGGGA